MNRDVINLFIGFDSREAIGFYTFIQSFIERSSLPVSIHPVGNVGNRAGSNDFTFSRFLIPWLCRWEGYALWMDGADMLVMDDPAELWNERNGKFAVKVVKRDYQTKHSRKYVGTELECENSDYPRKNWSSLILWDCASFRNRMLTPEFVKAADSDFLHGFRWLTDDWIGELDPRWNRLVAEESASDAKIAHYTLGIPAFPAYAACELAEEWHAVSRRARFPLGESHGSVEHEQKKVAA